MMLFRQVKENIITILEAAQLQNFVTVKAQRQRTDGVVNLDNFRTATVFYFQGDFNQGAVINGPTQHAMTFRVELSCSKKAEGDLTPLQDLQAAAGAKEAALLAFKDSSILAGRSPCSCRSTPPAYCDITVSISYLYFFLLLLLV